MFLLSGRLEKGGRFLNKIFLDSHTFFGVS